MECPIRRIALLHHTGLGNLGDDAVVKGVISNIGKRWENAQFTLISMNPLDSEKRHGLPCYPIRQYQLGYGLDPSAFNPIQERQGWFRTWLRRTRNPAIRIPRGIVGELRFLKKSYDFIKSFDSLIVTGGGQLTERGGPLSFPYALFIWSLLAKRAGVKFMLLSIGAGPLNLRLSRFLVLRTLRRADYVSFRDQESRDLVRSLGFAGPAAVCPDNVYSLQEVPATAKTSAERIVGIAPMPFPFDDLARYPQNAQEIRDSLVKRMAAFASLVANMAFSLVLFGSDVRSDPPEIERLRTALLNRNGIALPEYLPHNSISELLNRMSDMDYVVTCRLHGVVFAHILNKPVLAISHHPKVTHLMKALGLSEYCVEMVDFDPIQLAEKFQSLVANTESVKEKMAMKLAEYRAQSAAQFDSVFPPGASVARELKTASVNSAGSAIAESMRDCACRCEDSRNEGNSLVNKRLF